MGVNKELFGLIFGPICITQLAFCNCHILLCSSWHSRSTWSMSMPRVHRVWHSIRPCPDLVPESRHPTALDQACSQMTRERPWLSRNRRQFRVGATTACGKINRAVSDRKPVQTSACAKAWCLSTTSGASGNAPGPTKSYVQTGVRAWAPVWTEWEWVSFQR